MRIYSMTATFGKLEHETLTLTPGLNIIHAPNEWGKSTWCAFLIAMLYGLDTRAKSTKTALADKERYAPWSGSPMAGRMDLNWNGRDITIERKTKGRIPLGEFRAYETESGIDIPELTAANCGQLLLGVEQSVFRRTGFIRLSDLPVTDDEALRRRLNSLVTTGDENSAGDRLAKELKDLKNRIRYNRTGLLPQAEAERAALEETHRELQALEAQQEQLTRRLDEIEDWKILLENHRAALAYAAAREDARRVEQAKLLRDEAAGRLTQAHSLCDALPERETAQELLDEIHRLEQNRKTLEDQLRMMPREEAPAEEASLFTGLCGEDAIAMARADRDRHWNLLTKKDWLLLGSALCFLLGIAVTFWYLIPGIVCSGVGILLLVWGLLASRRRHREARLLETHYGSEDPDLWMRMAEEYAARLYRRKRAAEESRIARQSLEQQLKALNDNIREATQGQGLDQCRSDWEGVIMAWNTCDEARKAWQQAQQHYETLAAMAKTAPAPEFPDRLTDSETDTNRLLSECLAEQQKTENRLGQCQGRMDTLGSLEALETQITRLSSRITRLETYYTALTIAQETLAEAATELQRRFAPRISKRAQTLMQKMTNGRYDRLHLGEDLNLRAGATQEDTLQSTLWRSDGTVDQLYLSLRLAVSGELTPDAPLILDDALVRFDDARLKAALEILREEAEKKQVLLFTCQSREMDMM